MFVNQSRSYSLSLTTTDLAPTFSYHSQSSPYLHYPILILISPSLIKVPSQSYSHLH